MGFSKFGGQVVGGRSEVPEDDLQFPAEIRSVPVEKGCGRTPSWRLLLIRLDFTGCLLCAEKVGGGCPLMKLPGFIVDSPVFGGETRAPVRVGISGLGLKTVSAEGQRSCGALSWDFHPACFLTRFSLEV